MKWLYNWYTKKWEHAELTDENAYLYIPRDCTMMYDQYRFHFDIPNSIYHVLVQLVRESNGN